MNKLGGFSPAIFLYFVQQDHSILNRRKEYVRQDDDYRTAQSITPTR